MRAKPILIFSSILRLIFLSSEVDTFLCLELKSLLGLELESLLGLELESFCLELESFCLELESFCLELDKLLRLELDTLLCSCSPALKLFLAFLLLLAPVPASCKNSHFFPNLQLPFLRANLQGILCRF